MNNLFYRRLKYGVISTLLITVSLSIAIKFLVEYRTNQALKDYSMLPNDVEVIDKVILGRSYPGFRYLLSEHMDYGINKLFRSGAIELVCTNQKDILLVVKDFMHKYIRAGASDKAVLHISFRFEDGLKKGVVKIPQINFLSEKYFDTLASNPLSELEIDSIIKALEERTFDRISFSTLEGGNSFYGDTEVSKVKMLVARCQQTINN